MIKWVVAYTLFVLMCSLIYSKFKGYKRRHKLDEFYKYQYGYIFQKDKCSHGHFYPNILYAKVENSYLRADFSIPQPWRFMNKEHYVDKKDCFLRCLDCGSYFNPLKSMED